MSDWESNSWVADAFLLMYGSIQDLLLPFIFVDLKAASLHSTRMLFFAMMIIQVVALVGNHGNHGTLLAADVCVTVLGLISTELVEGILKENDNNKPLLQSSIGKYVMNLPWRLSVASLYLWMLWVVMTVKARAIILMMIFISFGAVAVPVSAFVKLMSYDKKKIDTSELTFRGALMAGLLKANGKSDVDLPPAVTLNVASALSIWNMMSESGRHHFIDRIIRSTLTPSDKKDDCRHPQPHRDTRRSSVVTLRTGSFKKAHLIENINIRPDNSESRGSSVSTIHSAEEIQQEEEGSIPLSHHPQPHDHSRRSSIISSGTNTSVAKMEGDDVTNNENDDALSCHHPQPHSHGRRASLTSPRRPHGRSLLQLSSENGPFVMPALKAE